jgi:hypothetical protein
MIRKAQESLDRTLTYDVENVNGTIHLFHLGQESVDRLLSPVRGKAGRQPQPETPRRR